MPDSGHNRRQPLRPRAGLPDDAEALVKKLLAAMLVTEAYWEQKVTALEARLAALEMKS